MAPIAGQGCYAFQYRKKRPLICSIATPRLFGIASEFQVFAFYKKLITLQTLIRLYMNTPFHTATSKVQRVLPENIFLQAGHLYGLFSSILNPLF